MREGEQRPEALAVAMRVEGADAMVMRGEC
jgi:hypothetical protein